MTRTLFYTLLFSAALALGLEGLLRQPAVAERLWPPAFGTDYVPLGYQFRQLEAHIREQRTPDCFFVGSSVVLNGLHPTTVEAAFRAQSGESLHCFTVGLPGLTSTNAQTVIQSLSARYSPRLVVYAVQPSEWGACQETNCLAANAWLAYLRGEASLRGALFQHSHLYRYFFTLPDYPKYYAELPFDFYDLGTRRESGFQPLLPFIQANRSYQDFLTPPPDWLASYTPTHRPPRAEYEGLLALAETPTRLVLVEMPNFRYQRDDESMAYGAFVDEVFADFHAVGIPAWRTVKPILFSAPFSEPLWYDDLHLNVAGALRMSDWLGVQLGRAASEGLFSAEVPPDLLKNPPAPTYSPAPPTWRESDQAAYTAHPAPYAGRIFDPSRTWVTDDWMLEAAGLYLAWWRDVTPAQRDNLFDLLRTAQMADPDLDSPAIQAWRADKKPEHLRQAGVDYLFVSSEWRRFLSEEEKAQIDDPQHYRLVRTWTHPALNVRFWLYALTP